MGVSWWISTVWSPSSVQMYVCSCRCYVQKKKKSVSAMQILVTFLLIYFFRSKEWWCQAITYSHSWYQIKNNPNPKYCCLSCIRTCARLCIMFTKLEVLWPVFRHSSNSLRRNCELHAYYGTFIAKLVYPLITVYFFCFRHQHLPLTPLHGIKTEKAACARLMLWLCTYHEFYNKRVSNLTKWLTQLLIVIKCYILCSR